MDDFLGAPRDEGRLSRLAGVYDPRARSDLLFLEAWEDASAANLGATLRASQIRRANLAAAIREPPSEAAAIESGTEAQYRWSRARVVESRAELLG
jgi:hypothetical protein